MRSFPTAPRCLLLVFAISTILAGTAFTQIRYTDIEPDTLIADTNDIPGEYKLDLDRDGTPDYFILHFFFPVPAYVLAIYTEYGMKHEMLLDAENNVRPLAAGSMITDSSADWFCSASGGKSSGMAFSRAWSGTGDHYVGLRVRRDGAWHNGWLRAVVAEGDRSILLKDFAVETQPDTPIKAGETGMVDVRGPVRSEELSVFIDGRFVTVALPYDIPADLSVFDIIGRERYRRATPGGSITVNLNDLPRGLYFLRVRTPRDTAIRRLALW